MKSIWRAKAAVQSAPLLGAAAVFVAAGAFVHARDWLDIYRHVPADLAGSAVVRVGFPINVGISVVLVLALVFCTITRSRYSQIVAVAGLVFQGSSLATLIKSRTGSVFGWSEPAWTLGADQTRAVEIGALIALTGVLMIASAGRRVGAHNSLARLDAVAIRSEN